LLLLLWSRGDDGKKHDTAGMRQATSCNMRRANRKKQKSWPCCWPCWHEQHITT
jgi:hypothetical protein